MRFYLGTHKPNWLAQTDVPLFISRRMLTGRRTFPRPIGPWALDSGGFTELSMFGQWTVSADDYVSDVRRFADAMGSPDFVAPQDWMCEAAILASTRKTIEQHQRLTVDNFVHLRDALGAIVIPVLQGWTASDYLRCVQMYEDAGVRLRDEPRVGVGTVCRRQDTAATEVIIRELSALGIRLHGFGVKVTGLRRYADAIASADSMAWSYHARMRPPMLGHSHKNCANCLPYALRWHARIATQLAAQEMAPLQTRWTA